MRLKRGVQKYTEEENKVAEQKEVLTIHKKWKKRQKKSPLSLQEVGRLFAGSTNTHLPDKFKPLLEHTQAERVLGMQLEIILWQLEVDCAAAALIS